MPQFRPGQSGNPSGRPRSAQGLKALLEARYGHDGEQLVGRLETLTHSKNPRVALEAVRLLMAYLCGPPERTLHLDVTRLATELMPVQLAMLDEAELAVLSRLSARLNLAQCATGLLEPDGRDDANDVSTLPGPSRSWPTLSRRP